MRHNRRGNIITTVLVIPVLVGIGSLSVDISQAYVAKAQLQNVVDLSTRSGLSLLDGSYEGMHDAVQTTIAVVKSNDVLGKDIGLTQDSVVTGYWSEDGDAQFVPSTDPDLVDALQVTASTDVEMYFADLFAGVETIPVSSSAVGVNVGGGAGSVDCFLPLAIPDCVLDDTSGATLQEYRFTLSPAGKDNVGWARPSDQGNPSAAWTKSQLLDCESTGTVIIGDELWLNNGLETTSIATLADMIERSHTHWDASVYGELPDQMDNSSVRKSEYGHVVEGAILVFEASEDYCSGNGSWNETDAVVTGMVWGAVYDAATKGAAETKNIKVKVDLVREHQVGEDTGGTDYGVQGPLPVLVR